MSVGRLVESVEDVRSGCLPAVGSVGAALVAGVVAALAAQAATGRVLVAWRCGLAAAGATVLAAACIFACATVRERRRRARVAELAERVDRILRDPRSAQGLEEYEEGELAVLANELQKMCVALRDQAEATRRERDGLADSLADISHQLRTPLASMNLSLELLACPDVDEARRRKALRDLRVTADHMGWLVTSLLTIARADAGALQLTRARVDVRDLVRGACDPLRIAFELADVALEVGEVDEELSFEGDAGWSREALANVVKNCLEHTPAGGAVRVEVSRDVIATRIRVSDTGPGISRADLPHVFERFYRGEGAVAGSAGIGLALARCLVAAQGGTLAAANGVGGGAVFTFTFPDIATV